MIMLSVYAQNTVSMRSCARSPECHVIRLEERARGPILQRGNHDDSFLGSNSNVAYPAGVTTSIFFHFTKYQILGYNSNMPTMIIRVKNVQMGVPGAQKMDGLELRDTLEQTEHKKRGRKCGTG